MVENWIEVENSDNFCRLKFKSCDNEINVMLDESDVLYLLKELSIFNHFNIKGVELA